MSLEITAIPRIAKVPIVDHFVQLIKSRIAEAQAKAEELRVRAKLPELKLPQLPELPPLPEKLLSLQEQGKALFELVQAQVTEKAIPIVATIDAFGNSRLDLAEKKFQFIFTASAEEIIQAAEDRRLEVVEKVQATFDEKVKAPLIAFGEDLDQRSEPFLKYAVDHFPIEVPQTEAQYNYQRALLLSKALGDKGVTYSTEQLRHLEEKSTFVARVSEKAKTTAATVKEKVDELPPFPRTLEEAKELSTTIIENVKERIQSIPPPPPEFKELFDKVPVIFSELVELVKDSEIPLTEKPLRIGQHVVERVEPEVEALKGRGLELFEEVKGRIGALRA